METMGSNVTECLNICVCTVYTGDVFMSNITLSVPAELKHKMDEFKDVNWSELTRRFITDKVERLSVLHKLDKMLENSTLTEEDCLRLGNELKERVWKRHKAEGW